MDTGKPALGKRVLSSFFALTLVMGLVPVSAYAEVGKAQGQQGQEQASSLLLHLTKTHRKMQYPTLPNRGGVVWFEGRGCFR